MIGIDGNCVDHKLDRFNIPFNYRPYQSMPVQYILYVWKDVWQLQA